MLKEAEKEEEIEDFFERIITSLEKASYELKSLRSIKLFERAIQEIKKAKEEELQPFI